MYKCATGKPDRINIEDYCRGNPLILAGLLLVRADNNLLNLLVRAVPDESAVDGGVGPISLPAARRRPPHSEAAEPAPASAPTQAPPPNQPPFWTAGAPPPPPRANPVTVWAELAVLGEAIKNAPDFAKDGLKQRYSKLMADAGISSASPDSTSTTPAAADG